MRLVLNSVASTALGIALVSISTHAFTQSAFSRGTFLSSRHHDVSIPFSHTELHAKAKKKKAPLVSNVDFDAFDDDEPMSKKDLIDAQKAEAKAAKKKEAEAAAATDEEGPVAGKKDRNAAAMKALKDMERAEANKPKEDVDEFGMPKAKLSKKEMKEAKKKEEKDAKKKAAKEAKMAKRAAEGDDEEAEAEVGGFSDSILANGDAEENVSTSFFHCLCMFLSIPL
jgi:FtsZ-interacting cell division protein ZipA